MAESEAYKKWSREKTVMISVRLQKSTDAEILSYLEGKPKQTTIKAALKEYIKNHPET